MSEDNLTRQLKSSLAKFSKNCSNLEDYINLAFDFVYSGHKLKPQQNKNEISILLNFLFKLKPKVILEIGTSEGGTLFLFSKIASSTADIISIDLLDGAGGGNLYQEWKESFYKSFSSKGQRIFLLREDSHSESTIIKVKEILEHKKIDFLFIDGDHSYESVKKDFELYFPLVSDNGLIAFHDINEVLWEKIGVQRFWNELKTKYSAIEIIDKDKNTGLGIGMVSKSNSLSGEIFVDLFKEIINMKDKKIQRLGLNPLSPLLSIYYERTDLQEKFPEVQKNNFNKLIQWGIAACESNESKKIPIKYRLMKHYKWYCDYLKRD